MELIVDLRYIREARCGSLKAEGTAHWHRDSRGWLQSALGKGFTFVRNRYDILLELTEGWYLWKPDEEGRNVICMLGLQLPW